MRHRGDLVTGIVAFVARAAVVLWAGGQFPPSADGVYYHAIAVRVSQGLGSTWLWPDGKITYARTIRWATRRFFRSATALPAHHPPRAPG